MTDEQYRQLLANASSATRALNLPPGGAGTAPVVERDSKYAAVGAVQVQERTGGHFLVRVEAVRQRLLDEDNLCEKFHVDLLRYSGVIPDDAPDKTKIEVSQRKAKKGEAEKIIIEVYERNA